MKNYLFIYASVIILVISSCCSIKKQTSSEALEATCQEIMRMLPSTITNNGEGEIFYDVELVDYMRSVWPCLEGKSKETVIGLFGKPASNEQYEDSSFISFNFGYNSKIGCHKPRKNCIGLYFLVDITDLTVYNYKIMAFN